MHVRPFCSKKPVKFIVCLIRDSPPTSQKTAQNQQLYIKTLTKRSQTKCAPIYGKSTRKKKYITYRGQILFYHRGKGPLGVTLSISFLAFWDVMGNLMNGTENNDKTKTNNIFWGLFQFFLGDFGGLILYLGFWGLDFGISSKTHHFPTSSQSRLFHKHFEHERIL